MKITKIKSGAYLTENGYWIVKTPKGWELRNQVTGQVYSIHRTRKEAIRETIF